MTAALSLGWPAPAKLNLFLHINGRREDGYHELQTLFQFIEHCDFLDFKVTENTNLKLHSNMSTVVADNDNLILRAAKSLQEYSQCQQGAEIWLDKRLPMGGGLGGGSSDAATTLVALNSLWGLNIPIDELAKIGLKLGADVPVFINGFSAFAEGVGEQLQPVYPPQPWYLVVVPDVHVSTAEIFQDPALPRNTPKHSLTSLMESPWKNDCQELVAKHSPQVAKALAWLLEYAPSRMTGTGACVFGQFEQEQQAKDALAKLPTSMNGFVAKGANKSPLMLRLAQC
ncbi:4-diphosphocytidyl-2C-methyl-D-erythritol kinase [Shewanella piezotolerans WP3]|uniref:4-diphosphocytidyl-2-C-methyl-D-erythritol kinase n=1 Tax=Shewanella piezotolerans (strain WP3 / JCM 13877) TaxID=225849 RepID=ISPE_SHEPW|nr:4-(cytidine 5'-diphospho)-2-C-methyl-D-erythritol kinase [Shewanella piezotolerans]B8CQV5.1 RecName: Full=4-diphosphocytidyl-2-C-methyl-D-erythritol kinase; Short=CMK; AltName: Full=4-(cytidine-5'-diphospho)-2-C-methyl-D-erythritol kinase [Shewanella piezotolerans WP3]ACJ30571.1 4-diphosphocytidyl-2C-methyl-D-erythritol kinase [Shewanella piezotolerans WP3]